MIGNKLKWFRILQVLSSKLRLEGNFDFGALARATPGYVGADLAALTGAAGVIAVKRIFQQISEGTISLPAADVPDFLLPAREPAIENARIRVTKRAESKERAG